MNAAIRRAGIALLVAAGCLAIPTMAQQATPPPISTIPVRPPQKLEPVRLAHFDAYVARVLKAFDVPGIAVAVVKDGHVVFEKGYGVRFEPLGMHDTRFNFHYIQPSDHDVTTGYAKYNYKTLKPVAPLAWANNSGAGGIYSSVHDMARWIIVQLNGGVYGKNANGSPQRLFSAARHAEMWSVQTAIHPRASKIPELAVIAPQYEGYGEGWHLSQFRHHKMVYHTGGWPGFVSRVTMIPDMHLGMVVLTNAQSGAAFQAITYRILDACMHEPMTDWIAVFQKADAAPVKSR